MLTSKSDRRSKKIVCLFGQIYLLINYRNRNGKKFKQINQTMAKKNSNQISLKEIYRSIFVSLFDRYHWSTRSSSLNIISFLFLLFTIFSAHFVRGEMLPPKTLTRVIAGFYSFHPVYETDKPAKIAGSERKKSLHLLHDQYGSDKTILSASSVRNIGDVQPKFVLDQHQSSKILSSQPEETITNEIDHHGLNNDDDKNIYPNYFTKISNDNRYKSDKSIKWSEINDSNEINHHFVDRMLKSYGKMAKKLAKQYGTKYNYPVDMLYVSSLNISSQFYFIIQIKFFLSSFLFSSPSRVRFLRFYSSIHL